MDISLNFIRILDWRSEMWIILRTDFSAIEKKSSTLLIKKTLFIRTGHVFPSTERVFWSTVQIEFRTVFYL